MDYEKLLLSDIRSTVQKYNMITAQDRVLCAVSGGKDSLTLAVLLKKLSSFYPIPFTVGAVLIDMGFEGADFSPVFDLFAGLEIPFTVVKTEIAKVTKLQNPCSLCSRMRRGALCDFAVSNGYTSLALGHNEDDVAQTAMMNLLYNGRFEAFAPVTDYSDRGIKIIRPLTATSEKLIISYSEAAALPIVKNPCPADRASSRQIVRLMLSDADKTCRGAAHRVASAALKLYDI